MFVSILCSLYFITSLILAANNPKCGWGSKRSGDYIFKWDPKEARPGTACPDKTSCANVVLQRDDSWLNRQGAQINKSYRFETRLPCVNDQWLCTPFAGGNNACKKFHVRWENWVPRSCNASADYDAYTVIKKQTSYYRCCDNQDYCNGKDSGFDFNTCTESATNTNYMSSLNTCWETVKKDFMKDLVCDAERGDILQWTTTCTDENDAGRTLKTLKRANPECKYRVTCAPEMRTLLKKFGECSCNAAKANGRSGAAIAQNFVTRWSRWCPGIKLTCNDGSLNLRRKYWRARYKFKVAVARALLDDAYRAKLRAKIAMKLNILESDIMVTVSENTNVAGRRRLMDDSTTVTIDMEAAEKATATYWKAQFNVADMTVDGKTASSGEASSSEQGAQLAGTASTSTTTPAPHKASVDGYPLFIATIMGFVSYMML